jgi:circadian clock protein KaiC
MVEAQSIKVLVIDSVSGYLNALPAEKLVLNQMHEMLTYLGHCGVLTLMVVTQHGMLAMNSHDPIDLSYLADTVLLLRHFEAAGAVRQAISVLKKRYAAHERSIRELSITAQGVQVGPPLSAFRGVLTGTPHYEGSEQSLLLIEQRPVRTATPPDDVRGGR